MTIKTANYINNIMTSTNDIMISTGVNTDGVSSISKPLNIGTGLRYNQGKLRYDLLPTSAIEELVKVLTKGSEKYTVKNPDGSVKVDGANNWRGGMSWRSVLASMKRHIAAFENGEDHDPESGLLHLGHVMCNAAFLIEYYKIFPQGDDRLHPYLRHPKIGLDIDEVIADFVGGMMKRFPEMENRSVYWNDPHILANFDSVKDDRTFWLGLEPKINSLPFEPHCYITSRPVPNEVTEEWLKMHGFPKARIYTVGHNGSKVDIARQAGIDIFVDDRFENFVELNKAGICCYLWDAPHNKRYNVGHKRLNDLKELI